MAILERDIVNTGLPQRRPLTYAAYMDLARLGYFDGERVELIDGEILTMAPMGDLHLEITDVIVDVFSKAIGDAHFISVQSTLKFSDTVVPEPDFAVFPGKPRDYHGKPRPTPVLIIEVANSSLQYDRTIKSNVYAAAGVPEYWIVNLVDSKLEVFRNPGAEGYAEVSSLEKGSRISPLFLPSLSVNVADLLP